MESRPVAGSSDDRALCTRCRRWWPAAAISCPSCGAELGAETVIDDVHRVDTIPVGATGTSAATSQTDTTPEGEAFASKTHGKRSGPGESELPLFAERTDEEIDHLTSVVPRKENRAAPAPSVGSSSDPPTRFLRGFEQHIELPSGSVVDDYEIDAKLGAGAMGVVYSARHSKLGRRVAIKVIAPSMGADSQALARFEREAKALASLHHPNIVDVYAFGTLPDERSYFAMEFLSGETLDERLRRGRMTLDEALDVLDQMARALEAAHAQGIVHRDLKPSNTFLVRLPREQRSVVKLIDFGLVQLAVADGLENTASGAMIGTALYISPEQARSPNVDGRTDVYALGVVAYELVLGGHPFPEARTATAALAAHLTEPPPQPRTIWPGIPAALDLLLYSMLAKDPSYRPTLAQVRNVIASVQSPTTTAGRELRAATAPVTGSTRYARAWTAALVAFALFVGIVIGMRVLAPSGRTHEPQPLPVEVGASNPGDTNEGLVPIKPNPRPTAVVQAPVIDAGVTPVQPPAEETAPSPEPETSIVEAPKPQVTPRSQITPTSERPVQRPLPTPPDKPPGRNDTINPYKRGSAGR